MSADDGSFYASFVGDKEDHLTNNYFNIQLNEELVFKRDYEVAITEVTIPSYVHNIFEDTYCTILRMRKGDSITSKDPMLNKIRIEHDGFNYVLDYGLRIKLTPGFYSSFEAVKKELKQRAFEIISNPRYKIVPYNSMLHEVNNSKKAHRYYWDIIDGKVGNFDEFYIGREYISSEPRDIKDAMVNDTLNNIKFFDRLKHDKYLDRVVIDSEDDLASTEDYITRMGVSESLRIFLGCEKNTLIVKPETNVLSDYRLRIYPYRHIFISTDIVKPRYTVNGLKTYCLREIPIERIPRLGQIIHHEFESLRYIPLQTRNIKQIGFGLWSEDSNFGALERFFYKDSQYKCVFTLHFRPMQ
ncbi:MAG: hypothetical protein HRT42_06850 [Campylobacteraceae bacterium]|nr:hypothetical protein [Campylobacteraceae bacterium]